MNIQYLYSRRDFIKFGAVTAAGLALNRLFSPSLLARENAEKTPKAKAVISI
ncbi:MAG: twin-arginine translocation signal domain-containing protein, partial [Opitutales bacterium]|nr:twin-arginine translocation signal domain-containing protein [Opitutales bacterium]